VHDVGGLLYYDGANLNAILGVVRPGDMGFDIVHMNLHKTFATPHGGGGPGAGPVAVSERLADFLPGPRPRHRLVDGAIGWVTPAARSDACTAGTATPWCWPGRWPTSTCTAATACAAWPSGPCSTPTGCATAFATRYDVPLRPALHARGVLTAAPLKAKYGVRGLDVAKRLLEEGFHSPTVYFPSSSTRP
jgi:glycine dehydrogenase subunit 2